VAVLFQGYELFSPFPTGYVTFLGPEFFGGVDISRANGNGWPRLAPFSRMLLL
jgi:hypothetical protein